MTTMRRDVVDTWLRVIISGQPQLATQYASGKIVYTDIQPATFHAWISHGMQLRSITGRKVLDKNDCKQFTGARADFISFDDYYVEQTQVLRC